MPKHRTATVLLSLLLATTTYGQDEFDNLEIESCKLVSIVAKEVMTARQKGQPMSETLPSAIDRFKDLIGEIGVEIDDLGGEEQEALKELEQVIAQLVMGAYEAPPFTDENAQRMTINHFENAAFAECYKGSMSDSEE